MTTIYITKYATTSGIHVAQAQMGDGNLCAVGYDTYVIGRDAFLTLEEAMAKAEAMRERRIRSLERQIQELREKQIKVRAE